MFDVKPITSERPNDCGATCLKMLLDYYGIEVPLAELIKDCNTRIIGCSGKDILVAGRKHGADMTAWKMDAEELVKQDRPAIIHWKYCHWVVFCGKDDDGNIVICNPDRGRYKMSYGIFESFFTDYVLANGEPHDLPEE